MLDFTLTDEQRNIRDMAHDFAEKEIRPVAWEYDRDAHLAEGDHRQGLGSRPDELPAPRASTAARAPPPSTAS